MGDCVGGWFSYGSRDVVVMVPCPAVVCIVLHFCFEACIAVFYDSADVVGDPVLKVMAGYVEFGM